MVCGCGFFEDYFFLGIFDYLEISILKFRFVLIYRKLGFIRIKLDN